MKVCVIGSGYVGLVAGACFAEYGNQITCVDIDSEKIEKLKKGIIPIFEPGLSELVTKNVKAERLFFTTSLKDGVESSEIIFIAVGTPTGAEGEADLSMVRSVAKEIGKNMNGYKIIVDKSTVPVGTADIVREIVKKETSHPFDVVSNPEFLKEGAAIDDFMRPERVVIGVDSESAAEAMKELYGSFVLNGNPILVMSPRSAELAKYAANSFLATKISFANEIANLCDTVGASYEDVRKAIGTDSRIGNKFLYAGIGYGGSCFPKDVRALLKTAKDYNVQMQVIQKVEEVNEKQKLRLMDKIEKHFKNELKGRIFGVWGLAFKPMTDDMREAPSIPLLQELHKKGAVVKVYDPAAMETSEIYFKGKVQYCENPYDVLKNADALLLLTEWREFREPDFKKMSQLMKSKLIFDGRNQYSKKVMKKEGFIHYSIGLGDG
ncbi:MAG TPA: UDP-glucose/GDP-mannose dehydrogenase family protein [Leptospiraceae bacterium]|nr:UDP-glucose/GDP-mannose dehydrogenase family protein [Leptospiraceae bacterium]HMY69520.1 UDP-glucose/GDP-mannose dehydrogenase family protein [Leptospiraceae bacterium]HNM01511.1 UDP-glucose/GDP-mannose dehydrogenase family protein [Leptospiraceae bacterium]HNN04043.1 UDP-glucose/GDP-mannose dehydrogenase family protein [Leptospiraceae bacterium]